jgi:hypothetical protein
MKNLKLILFTLILSGPILFSCKKDDNNTNQTIKTFVVNATSQTKWVYFSFDNNDTVKISNPTISNNWDLAFCRFNIKTNSGFSGNGIGGTYNSGKTGSTGFNQLITVPDTATFTVDDSLFIPGAYGIIDTVITNSILSGWYNYDQTTNVLSSKNLIYIVKTATGKYVKLQIVSYYNDTDPSLVTGSGYVKFNYFYQQNGSKSLQ